MNPKHTPTPWNTPAVTINDASKKIIAICTDRSNEENKANAAFIVRAVNSHDELLSALQQIGYKALTLPEIVQMARDVLAKVEAKS